VHRRLWQDLSGPQRGAILAASAVQVALQAATLIDLYRRPSGEISGDKRFWVAVSFVNFIGPVAYFVRGRKS
jgi:hypothetical protein